MRCHTVQILKTTYNKNKALNCIPAYIVGDTGKFSPVLIVSNSYVRLGGHAIILDRDKKEVLVYVWGERYWK